MTIPLDMRQSLFASTIVLVSALGVSSADACECDSPDSALKAAVQSFAVFTGTVTAIQAADDTKTSDLTIEFQVTKGWKGVEHPMLTVLTTTPGACGYQFKVGQSYLVYAQGNDEHLEVDNCHRTYLLAPPQGHHDRAGKDIKELNGVRWSQVVIFDDSPAN